MYQVCEDTVFLPHPAVAGFLSGSNWHRLHTGDLLMLTGLGFNLAAVSLVTL